MLFVWRRILQRKPENGYLLTTNLAFNFLSLSLFYSLLLAGRTHEVSSKIVRRIVWHLRVSQDFYAVLSALNAYNTGISRPSLVSFDQSRLPQLHRRVIENPISRDRLLLSPVSPPGWNTGTRKGRRKGRRCDAETRGNSRKLVLSHYPWRADSRGWWLESRRPFFLRSNHIFYWRSVMKICSPSVRFPVAARYRSFASATKPSGQDI